MTIIFFFARQSNTLADGNNKSNKNGKKERKSEKEKSNKKSKHSTTEKSVSSTTSNTTSSATNSSGNLLNVETPLLENPKAGVGLSQKANNSISLNNFASLGSVGGLDLGLAKTINFNFNGRDPLVSADKSVNSNMQNTGKKDAVNPLDALNLNLNTDNERILRKGVDGIDWKVQTGKDGSKKSVGKQTPDAPGSKGKRKGKKGKKKKKQASTESKRDLAQKYLMDHLNYVNNNANEEKEFTWRDPNGDVVDYLQSVMEDYEISTVYEIHDVAGSTEPDAFEKYRSSKKVKKREEMLKKLRELVNEAFQNKTTSESTSKEEKKEGKKEGKKERKTTERGATQDSTSEKNEKHSKTDKSKSKCNEDAQKGETPQFSYNEVRYIISKLLPATTKAEDYVKTTSDVTSEQTNEPTSSTVFTTTSQPNTSETTTTPPPQPQPPPPTNVPTTEEATTKRKKKKNKKKEKEKKKITRMAEETSAPTESLPPTTETLPPTTESSSPTTEATTETDAPEPTTIETTTIATPIPPDVETSEVSKLS